MLRAWLLEDQSRPLAELVGYKIDKPEQLLKLFHVLFSVRELLLDRKVGQREMQRLAVSMMKDLLLVLSL